MPRRLVLLSAVLFGTTGTARALGPGGLSPLVAGAARIAVGGALLAAFARLSTERGTAPRMSKGALVVAAVAVAAYQLSFFQAVRDTGVAVGTVVALGSAPAFAGALARVVLGAPLTRRWGLSTALATAGVALLAGAGHAATVSLRGVLLALAAGAGYAVYTVVAKRELEAGHAPERVMAAAFGLGAVLLLPILLAGDTHALWTPGGLGLALYLGAIPTAVAYVLFARGLRQLGAGETATLTLAEPLTAAALGAVVLGERPGPLAVAGAALVLAGLAALALPPGRRAAAAAESAVVTPVPVP